MSKFQFKPLPIGSRFGSLVVISELPPAIEPTRQVAVSLCECDCGNKRIAKHHKLRSGLITSCLSCGRKRQIKSAQTHGLSHTSHEYTCWCAMRRRCTSPSDKLYPRYGGAGISVCEQWASFVQFLADMGPSPTPRHSLDRYPDGTGNYEPGNVRWATYTEQNRNRKNTIWLTVDGVTRCFSEHCSYFGIHKSTAINRLKKGWAPDQIFGLAAHPDSRTKTK